MLFLFQSRHMIPFVHFFFLTGGYKGSKVLVCSLIMTLKNVSRCATNVFSLYSALSFVPSIVSRGSCKPWRTFLSVVHCRLNIYLSLNE